MSYHEGCYNWLIASGFVTLFLKKRKKKKTILLLNKNAQYEVHTIITLLVPSEDIVTIL